MQVIFNPEQQRVPLKVWASDLDPGATEQALNLTRLPFAFKHIALMPDAHHGYGMPIGGVLAAQGHVIPNAVGVDIGCFTGDTHVPLANGTEPTLAELTALGGEHCVYVSSPSGRVLLARATANRTRLQAELLEIVLDNGAVIRCTPDHQFMMRDGTFREAQHLHPGASLMPLYRKADRDGYTLVQQNYSGRWQKAHWVAARSGLLGTIPRYDGERTVVHHKNFDEGDNDPSNLQFMSAGEHTRYHHGLVERNTHWQSEEFEQKRKAALSALAATPEGHDMMAKRGTANITRYMAEHQEHFREVVAGNGERGRGFLTAYNKSERGRAKSSEIANRLYPCRICDEVARSGFGIHNHRRRVHKTNHKVASIRPLSEREDVYCLTVPGFGNFALSAGVFVHNCGMHARRTNIEAGRLLARDRRGSALRRVLDTIQQTVPAGNGPAGNHRSPQPMTAAEGLEEVQRLLAEAPPELVKAWTGAAYQLGTLGGGNHFLEVQADEDGFVWLMLHSGSRALGKNVCDHFNALARALNQREGAADAVRNQLAYLPVEGATGRAYLDWMRLSMAYALENRRHMLNAAVEALFSTVRGISPDHEYLITEAVDTHHNYADSEHHFGEDVLVHRKGAVRAREGEMVIIPGSMETGSYIARGLGNREAFETCSHGAGRRLSRTAARKERTADHVLAAMQEKGIEIAKREINDVAEEAGHAYKDVDQIMRDSADLVEPVYRLRPLGVMKG